MEQPSIFNPNYNEIIAPLNMECMDDNSDAAELIAKQITKRLPLLVSSLKDSQTGTLRHTATILDVGCGEGSLVKILTDAEYNAYGIDIDQSYKSPKRKIGWESLGVSERCRVVDANTMIENKAIFPNSIDIVVTSHFHDFTYDESGLWWPNGYKAIDITKFISEIQQVLKPNGVYLCFMDYQHLNRLQSHFKRTDNFKWLGNEQSISISEVVFQKLG